MAISSIGVGSGLKLDELLEDLRKTEKKSLAVIQNRQGPIPTRSRPTVSSKAVWQSCKPPPRP